MDIYRVSSSPHRFVFASYTAAVLLCSPPLYCLCVVFLCVFSYCVWLQHRISVSYCRVFYLCLIDLIVWFVVSGRAMSGASTKSQAAPTSCGSCTACGTGSGSADSGSGSGSGDSDWAEVQSQIADAIRRYSVPLTEADADEWDVFFNVRINSIRAFTLSLSLSRYDQTRPDQTRPD